MSRKNRPDLSLGTSNFARLIPTRERNLVPVESDEPERESGKRKIDAGVPLRALIKNCADKKGQGGASERDKTRRRSLITQY